MNKERLSFISDEDLYAEVQKVIDVVVRAGENAETKLFNNVIDPFSAIFDATCQGISLTQWIKQEKARQAQKTLQNSLGNFHQEIIGCMKGWNSLKTGKVVDVINKRKRILGEIKNKYNTTKGNHKVAIYDDLLERLTNEYNGYTAYYVEIIPKNKTIYDKPFTPPDNRTHVRRPKNQKIRIIDGKSFYDLASGEKDALRRLYLELPSVISEIAGVPVKKTIDDKLYLELFERAF